jgi:hypothetical protein
VIIKRIISDRAVSKDGILHFLNEEVRPLLREIRARFNALDELLADVTTVTTTSTTLEKTQRTVIVDDTTAGGAVTVNLPTYVDNLGLQYVIKKVGNTADVTVAADTGETIDGSATYVLTVQFESVSIIAGSDGWLVL